MAYHAVEDFGREVVSVVDREDVVKFGELAFDLFEFWLVGQVKEDAACFGAGQRNHDDGFEVEGAAGEKSGDVRHRAGMVAHDEFEEGRFRRSQLVT